MPRQTLLHLILAGLYFFCAQAALQAQDFKVFNRTVQIHGFASQGFVYTSGNNWLTMGSNAGSLGFTDFGLNISAPLTDKLRVGAQVYDRNLGQLGQYHPSLDWAVVDYRFKSWFGVRGGKVKTILGLWSDTQDLDFLHTFALLPQSVYPIDIRDATIAHEGGDIYGTVSLKRRLGDLSYTAYVGRRHDSNYSAYAYFLQKYGIAYSTYGGMQYGGDLRWTTPFKGLLIGVSRMNEDLTDKGSLVLPDIGLFQYSAVTRADWTNQFYGSYTVGKLRVDSEYRRFIHDQVVNGGFDRAVSDVRGWYVSGSYRVAKRLAVGSYYSRYTITSVSSGEVASAFTQQTDTSLPANHIYDKVITARVDLNKYWNAKVEGHFMNGYGNSSYPAGFYPQVNPQGFVPNTNALVLKTSVNF